MTMKRAAAAASRLLLLIAHVVLVYGSTSSLHPSNEANSLDGYAFQCENIHGERIGAIGFRSINEIYCMNQNEESNNNDDNMPCGHYSYNHGVLSGFSTLMGPFRAHSLERRDGVVVSFSTRESVTCLAVSLDWSNYSHDYFLGLSCPSTSDGATTTRNHFTFGLTGDVALRKVVSTLPEIDESAKKSSVAKAQNVTYDYYGVFQYQEEKNRIHMDFGPQQGRDKSWTLRGTLTRDGQLVLQDDDSAGACIHDGQSRVVTADAFTNQLLPVAKKKSTKRTSHRQAWDSTVIAVGHLSATTAAALGVSVTLDKRAPAYGLVAGWGLKAVGDGVTKKLNQGKRYFSKTLLKGAMIQKMLCAAGSAVCVAASAASVFDVMLLEQVAERFRNKRAKP